MNDCKKERNGADEWICHRCGSLWTDMLAGTGWLPLSCPGRQDERYEPEPGAFDTELKQRAVEIISKRTTQIGGVTVNFTVGRIGRR
jgi:hypothetical protein